MIDEAEPSAQQAFPGELDGWTETTQQSITASGSARQTFIVKQGETEYEVEALHHEDFGNRTVEEFYGYGDGDGASANTPNGMERENVSQLFFYEGPEKTSLVIIHDKPNDGDGGEVRFEFDSLPEEGEWAVPDDPWEGLNRTSAHWNWSPCCTDGGAYSGFETAFFVELTPDFEYGIDTEVRSDEWILVDGSGSTLDRKPLDTGSSVQLASLGKLTSPDDANFVIDLPLNPCLKTDIRGAEFCAKGGSKVKIGPRECRNQPGGETPPLVSVDISYFQTNNHGGMQYSRSFWVGVELEGQNPCLWVGEEDAGACTRVQPSCGNVQTVVSDDLPSTEDARELATAVWEALTEIISDIEVPDYLVPVIIAVLLVIVVVVAIVAIFGTSALIAILGITGGITAAGSAAS